MSVVRDRKYLDWLKVQPCVVTLLWGRPVVICANPHLYWKMSIIDPAHGPPAGVRMKGPDNEAIPLARVYHEEQTEIGWPAFEVKYGINRDAIAAEHYARFKQEQK